jgi:hypothetical protein
MMMAPDRGRLPLATRRALWDELWRVLLMPPRTRQAGGPGAKPAEEHHDGERGAGRGAG